MTFINGVIMENTLNHKKNPNLIHLIQNRERNCEAAKLIQRHSQFTKSLIERLDLQHELEGHQGCVNCLQWNSDGSLLASGSDDTNVIIWDPFRYKCLKTVPTPHIGNIFSVKFLGSDDSLVATGAGDCRVIVQSIDQALMRHTPHLDCGCHVGRVKRLATSPEHPLLFWSAGEDGLVIQYDMREPHECQTKSTVFVDLSFTSEVKCIAVNPTKPHLIAVGANDCFIRLYDRRMVRTVPYRSTHSLDARKRLPPDPIDPNCVQYYAPGHLARDSTGDIGFKLCITYVAFDATGTEMLVNMGGEQIYLYNLNNSRSVNSLQIPPNFLNRTASSSDKKLFVNNGLKVKTLNGKSYPSHYLDRAEKFFNRKWLGDVYSAARDYIHVIHNWPDLGRAYVGLIECLISMKWKQEAVDWLDYFTKHFAGYTAKVKELQEEIGKIMNEDKNKDDEDYKRRPVSDEEMNFRLNSYDYEVRFVGHCNITTDIKEANFLGEDGKFICAGSDDGVIFIWDRENLDVVNALLGDIGIVNCIQPHPSACFIASSGIDPSVKLWAPIGEEHTSKTRIVETVRYIESNQQRMQFDPFEQMLANMGYRIRGDSPTDDNLPPGCRTS